MAKQKNWNKNLAEALHQTNDKQPNVAVVDKKEDRTIQESPFALEKPKVPPSRKGMKFVSAHCHPDISRRLKYLAVERDTSIKELLTEAINDLFQKYNFQ